MRRNTQHDNSVSNDSATDEMSYPNIYLQFLKLAVNVMAGIALLQHLYQMRDESRELVRVSRTTEQLSLEVSKLMEEEAQHELKLQSYKIDFDRMEEELDVRHQNFVRKKKEIDLLHEENETLDEELLSLEKLSALSLFMSPSILMPSLMTGCADSDNESNEEIVTVSCEQGLVHTLQ